jgi:hypothetical protein
MGQDTEIPGLIAISEIKDPDGQTRFIFEIEDDKVDQFYTAFGLQPGDEAGFRRVLLESIEMMLARKRANDASEEAGA